MGANTVFTAELLREFDGTNGKPIYIALQGKVYDVSKRRDLYGEGTGYHRFAGRNVTRSYAKVSLKPEDIGSSDLSDCSAPENIKALGEWIAKYSSTYPIVGNFVGGEIVGAKANVDVKRPTELPPRGEGKPNVISRRPLVVQVDDFLSAEECDLAKAIFYNRSYGRRFSIKVREPLDFRETTDPIEVAFLQSVEDRCNELLGWPAEIGEISLVAMLTPPGSDEADMEDPHLGLHVDTNQCEYRYATVLIYLSEPTGGCTSFPVSPTSVFTMDAAETLLANGIDHTTKVIDDLELRSAKEMLLNAAYSGEGLTVEPKTGMAVVFWSRSADGTIDPTSFHGGLSVGPGVPKITMQKFKEIPHSMRTQIGPFVASTRSPYENA